MVRSFNKRLVRMLALLCAAWATYEVVTFPRSAAIWAHRFEVFGLTQVPRHLYTFGINQAPRTFPDWAFIRLARLQPSAWKSAEIANVAWENNHRAIAATLYRSAIQEAGRSSPPEWFLKYADLVAPRNPRMVAPLLALFLDGPASVIELAEALKAKRSRLAMRLYEVALRSAASSARAEWIAGYAELLFRSNPNRAADLFLMAAALDLDRRMASQGLRYMERSLAAREDTDVLVKLTQLYLEHDRPKAEPALLRMIALDHNFHWAHHTLGMLHWDKNRLDEARSHLVEAAGAEPYRNDLENFDAWRKEADELRDREATLDRSLDDAKKEHVAAVSNHERLSSRLRQYDCDVRYMPDWEMQTDQQLRMGCIADGVSRGVAALFMLGVPVLRGAGAVISAEARAAGAAAAGRVARGAVAAGIEVAVSQRLARHSAGSAEFARESLSLRKSRVIQDRATFRAEIEAEHSGFVGALNTSFSLRREQVIASLGPAIRASRMSVAGREVPRNKLLLELRTSQVKLKVNWKLVEATEENCADEEEAADCRRSRKQQPS
jgi:tetratricopeptide (TPR) repeat protein